MSDRETNLLASVTNISRRFYLWVGGLSVIVLWGVYAYVHQVRQGLIVTGMRDEITWGLYIINFVFFIDISKGGALISAALRLSHAEWRGPITRLAEAMTVFALCIAMPMILFDVGRPDRVLSLLRHARIQSTIIWDVVGVATYLVASVVYLYLPLIPDLATLATQPGMGKWRRRLYRTMAVGWTGSADQWQLLKRAIGIMTVVVIPLAISMPTSWIFAMTLRPGWNSAIFGPYFVMAALYSGCAIVILSMYLLRRIFRLENYLEQAHFRNLGSLLLLFSVFFLYFNINEYLTMSYKSEGAERDLLNRLISGEFASHFWMAELLSKPLPLFLLLAILFVKPWQQYVVAGTILASAFVVVGIWLEHFIVVVPTLASPLLPMQRVPEEWMYYNATWVEWSITIAAFAAFLLVYSLLSKLFPLVSIWESRPWEIVPTREMQVAPAMQPQPSLPRSLSVLFLACLSMAAVSAQAQEPPAGKPRKGTVLSIQGAPVLPANRLRVGPAEGASEPVSPGPASSFADRIWGNLSFRSEPTEAQEPPPAIALLAVLHDEEGKPIGFQVIRFILKTSFGSELEFGSRPTDAEGKAQLVINDPRCGKHLVKATYLGNSVNAATSAEATVDFGPCPAPSLPSEGILITPYATPNITLPLVGFYGLALLGVIYSFGYLVLWRLRRAGKGGGGPVPPPGPGSAELPSLGPIR